MRAFGVLLVASLVRGWSPLRSRRLRRLSLVVDVTTRASEAASLRAWLALRVAGGRSTLLLGKGPVLVDGELELRDPLAICEYVAEIGGLWPRDAAQRARARQAACLVHSGLLEDEFWAQCLGRLADRGPYLFGSFSVADAMCAPIALRLNGTLQGAAGDYCATICAMPEIAEWHQFLEEQKPEIPLLVDPETDRQRASLDACFDVVDDRQRLDACFDTDNSVVVVARWKVPYGPSKGKLFGSLSDDTVRYLLRRRMFNPDSNPKFRPYNTRIQKYLTGRINPQQQQPSPPE